MARTVAAATLVGLASAGSYSCPKSSAFIHAWSEQTAALDKSCAQVKAEIKGRIAGTGGWVDPHNKGQYSVLSEDGNIMQLKRTTANGKYTDKINLELEDSGASCVVKGCSQSQVTSVMDFSTNFCNIRMLTCGTADGCKSATGVDWTDKITDNQQSPGSSNKMSDCLKVTEVASTGSYSCPKSSAFIHAWSEQTAAIDKSCADVKAEIQGRIAGTGGWVDPHNKGQYSVLSEDGNIMHLKRTTANGQYTDKIDIELEGSGASCVVKGCSQSQVTSVLDFSTNFCNIRMLTCGSGDKCKSATGVDWTDKITDNQQSHGSSNKMEDCLKVTEEPVVV